MSAYWLWVRRTWWLGPLLGVATVPIWLRSPGFHTDWTWMLSIAQGTTMLMSPLAAGAAELVLQTQWPQPVLVATRGTRRHWSPLVNTALGVLFWAMVILGLGLSVGAALCWFFEADPAGTTLPWQLVTGPFVLISAITLGVAAIVVAPGVLTPPLVTVGVFLLHPLLWELALPQLFSLTFATGISTPLRPMAVHMVNDILANCAATAALVAMVGARLSLRRSSRVVGVGLSVACWGLVILLAWRAVTQLPLGTYA